MKIASFTRVANVAELVGPGPFALSADGVDLAAVHTLDGWRAFEGRCPHLGALLGEGEIEGGHLVCRNHRWRFDIASGQIQLLAQLAHHPHEALREVVLFEGLLVFFPGFRFGFARRLLDVDSRRVPR